jgi:hypothetical protein
MNTETQGPTIAAPSIPPPVGVEMGDTILIPGPAVEVPPDILEKWLAVSMAEAGVKSKSELARRMEIDSSRLHAIMRQGSITAPFMRNLCEGLKKDWAVAWSELRQLVEDAPK